MFDFFKKSRAFDFLCSACLLCSLGSFTLSAEGEPAKVGNAYVQGPLGFESNHIMLDGATIDDNGLMNNGTLKWKTTTTIDTYSKGDQKNKTLDEAWTDVLQLSGTNQISALTAAGYTSNYENGVFSWTTPDGTIFSGNDSQNLAWNHLSSTADPKIKKSAVLSKGWTVTTEVITNSFALQNPNENSKLALFLKSGNDYVGATSEIDLSELGEDRFTLNGVKFYDSTTDDVIGDESSATPLSCKPGVYPLHAILTEKGDKTLMSGPVADDSDESA